MPKPAMFVSVAAVAIIFIQSGAYGRVVADTAVALAARDQDIFAFDGSLPLEAQGYTLFQSNFSFTDSSSNITAPIIHGGIYCRNDNPQFYPTTVDGCRPTLNSLRTFPDFARRQLFQFGPPIASPRLIGDDPPYQHDTNEGDCAICLDIKAFGRPKREFQARFSWKDVRAVATEIIQFCVDNHAGKGGLGSIGDPAHDAASPGWLVAAVGLPPDMKEGGTSPPTAQDLVNTFA